MTIVENCYFYGYLYGMNNNKIRVRIKELLTLLELPHASRLVRDLRWVDEFVRESEDEKRGLDGWNDSKDSLEFFNFVTSSEIMHYKQLTLDLEWLKVSHINSRYFEIPSLDNRWDQIRRNDFFKRSIREAHFCHPRSRIQNLEELHSLFPFFEVSFPGRFVILFFFQ